jgi:hypothetical protein
MTSLIYAGIAAFGVSQPALAGYSSVSMTAVLETGQQLEAPIMLAAGIDTRVERRHDVVDNAEDRIDDKQDFREERRDCTGEGPECRSDNRQDKRQDTVDRAEDRIDDRQDRR